jgi:hypothetical protein
MQSMSNETEYDIKPDILDVCENKERHHCQHFTKTMKFKTLHQYKYELQGVPAM